MHGKWSWYHEKSLGRRKQAIVLPGVLRTKYWQELNERDNYTFNSSIAFNYGIATSHQASVI